MRPKFREGIWNPETKGIQPEFLDNRIPKNELRSIVESIGLSNLAMPAILSDFWVRLPHKWSESQVTCGKLNRIGALFQAICGGSSEAEICQARKNFLDFTPRTSCPAAD